MLPKGSNESKYSIHLEMLSKYGIIYHVISNVTIIWLHPMFRQNRHLPPYIQIIQPFLFFPLCGVDVRIQVWMSDSQEPAKHHSQFKCGSMDPTCQFFALAHEIFVTITMVSSSLVRTHWGNKYGLMLNLNMVE